MTNREIEVRFLDVAVDELKQKLRALGATDHGEELLNEIVFYDTNNTWQAAQKLVRVRSTGHGTTLTYKHHQTATVDGTEEIEISVDDFSKTVDLLNSLGFLKQFRHQQKKRHSFSLGGVTIDFDTWPRVPTFVELEGTKELDLQKTAEALGLRWSEANTTNAAAVIESYGIPVKTLHSYTFSEIY